MRTLRLIALIAALAAVGPSACSTATIQVPAWGFGLTLGETLDKASAQPVNALIAGRALYRVRPPQPHRAMSEYAVITELKSGRILGIVGWDRYSSEEACRSEKAPLERALERRYGPGRPVTPADRERLRGMPETLNIGELTVFTQWMGIAGIGCAGPHLVVVYWYEKAEPDSPAPRN